MLYQGSIHYPVGKLVMNLSNNKSMGFYTEGPIFRGVCLYSDGLIFGGFRYFYCVSLLQSSNRKTCSYTGCIKKEIQLWHVIMCLN
jgi:hypothetical protein